MIIINDYLKHIKPDLNHGNDADVNPESEDFYFKHWQILSTDRKDFTWSRNKTSYYGGDTILSIKTVLGKNDWRLNRAIEYALESGDFTAEKAEDLRKRAKMYRRLYHTFANFMPLWKTHRRTNLNLAKGNWFTYKDFPDDWLNDIKKWYVDANALSERTFNLFNSNKDYFDKFIISPNDRMENWKNYVNKNYLDPFVKKDYEVRVLFKGNRRPNIWGILSAEQIDEFLGNAIKIIITRSRLLEKSKKSMPEFFV